MHTGATTLPKQVIIHTARGTNSVLELPGGCSILDYRAPDFPVTDRIEVVGGLRVLPVASALVRVPAAFFESSAADAQILLAQLPDASDPNRELLAGGHSVVAGRLAALLRAVGRAELADDIFIHPYMDGNGRIGRFLMNAMLASGGFPWTVIRVEWRAEYLAALDAASARGEIAPLTTLLAKAVSGAPPN